MAQGKLIEVPEGTGAAFGGLEISAITDGFEGADALPVELLIAEGLVITSARADADMKSGVKRHLTCGAAKGKKVLAAQDDRTNVVRQTAFRLS